MTTKLQNILNDKNLTQGDFINKVKDKFGNTFTRSYVSKICAGIITNYTLKTAIIISETLNVSVDDIVDENVKISIAEKAQEKINAEIKN
jgi:transcriptional regulator with XRE-family HTH domain